MNKQFDFNRFCNGVEGVLAVKEALTNDPAGTNDWRKRLAALKDSPLRLVVMGECKRGKSSFVNALLGAENLVPVATDIATSTIFRVRYGQKVSYTVHFAEDTGKEPLAVAAADLPQYGTEDGNPGNEKGVAFVEVTCPSKLLENRIEIVDTPGLGGLIKDHRAITYQYVPFADAVFVVTDSDGSPLGQAELDLLKDLKEVTENIYFVQTKSRLVDDEARAARRENNIRILADKAGFDGKTLKYFVVDSVRKTEADKSGDAKILRRSGFDEVLSFMDTDICPNARKIAAERFMRAFVFELKSVQGLLAERKVFINVKTPKELEQLQENVKKVMEELQEWQSKTLPTRRHAFELEILDAESGLSRKIAASGADGEFGQALKDRVFSAKSLSDLRDEVQKIRPEIAGRFAELNQTVRKEMLEKFNDALRAFLAEGDWKAHALEDDLTGTRNVAVRGDQPEGYREYKAEDRLNRTINAVMAGTYRGAVIYGAVGFFLAGPVGGTIGATIGQIDFTWRTWKAASAKELAAGQAHYWQQIATDLAQNSRRITTGYSEFLRKTRSELFFAIDQGIRESRSRMDQNILELKRKLASKSQDNSLEKARLTKLEQSFASSSVALAI